MYIPCDYPAESLPLSPSPFLADLDVVLLCRTIFRSQLVSNPFARIPLAIWRCPRFFLSFPVVFHCTPDRCFYIVVCLYDFPMLRLFFLHFRCLFSENSSKHPHLRFFLGGCRTSFLPISSHGRTLADFL